jgi:hypothetical protein
VENDYFQIQWTLPSKSTKVDVGNIWVMHTGLTLSSTSTARIDSIQRSHQLCSISLI